MPAQTKSPSPAIAFVGRHNSGKTTLIEQVVKSLSARELDVATIKHHTHGNFDIDVAGKDSYRHKSAGATEVVIASPTKLARVQDLDAEVECSELIDSMPGHDIIIAEGYRQSGLPTIEVIRKDNPRDLEFANGFESCLKKDKKPVAVVSDIDSAINICTKYDIKTFNFEHVQQISDFLISNYCRKKISLVIQAGGESRRMGFPKEELVMDGKHVIESQIERFASFADEAIITTNHPERLNFLNDNYSLPVRIEADIIPNKGALSAMYTALAKASFERVCCIACDMLFASENLLSAQIKIMNLGGYDAVIPVNKHGREPFHALYERKNCLEAVKRAMDVGKTRVQGFVDDANLKIYEMTQAEVRQAVPRGGCFINVNTPDDVKKYSVN